MRDVARPDAACDAQDALDEDFAGGPQADGRGEFSAGVGDGTSTQMPGRRTPAKAMLPQSSSWPECSTMRGGAIVPKVTGPKEIRPKLSAGRRRDGLALRRSCKGTAEPCPVKATLQPLLCGAVMMMAMVAVMMSGGKGRAGTNEHKENGSENLLHGTNVARALLWKPAGPGSGSSKERAFPAGRRA